jgi:hypothetical protein
MKFVNIINCVWFKISGFLKGFCSYIIRLKTCALSNAKESKSASQFTGIHVGDGGKIEVNHGGKIEINNDSINISTKK